MSETLAPVKPGRLIINGEAVDAASGATFRQRTRPRRRSSRPSPKLASRTWTAPYAPRVQHWMVRGAR